MRLGGGVRRAALPTRLVDPSSGHDHGRLPWVDVVRGAAIVLVTLYHAVLFTEGLGLGVGAWATVNQALQSARMPLFFLVSGLLVARSLDRPWADLARTKMATWGWLYLVWALVSMAVFSVVTWYRPGHPADSPRDLLALLVWPENGQWYLYALVLFLVLLRATRRVPAPVVVAVLAVLSVVAGTETLSTGNFAFDDMGRYVVYFAIGARAPGLVRSAAAAVTGRRAAVVAAAYAGITAAIAVAGQVGPATMIEISRSPLVAVPWSLLAAATGVALAVRFHDSSIGRGLGFLGRRTLPVYVAHETVLGCLAAVVALSPVVPAWTGAWLPLALCAAAIPLTLGLHRIFGRVPALYRAPQRRPA